jgi:hypothetical protein
MRWFAWRPVNTLTHGWRWLCWIERKRIMCNTEGDIRLVGWSFWLYRKDSVWQRGSAHYAKIRKAADSLPREDVERVWNAMVDKRLIEDVRPQFYWRWPQ